MKMAGGGSFDEKVQCSIPLPYNCTYYGIYSIRPPPTKQERYPGKDIFSVGNKESLTVTRFAAGHGAGRNDSRGGSRAEYRRFLSS
jgi:hypothetical protein